MQRALLGLRKSQLGISRCSSRNWLKDPRQKDAPQTSLASRRHISYPNFITHAAAEHIAGKETEELRARAQNRGAHSDEDMTFSKWLRLGIGQALSEKHRVTKAQTERPQAESSPYGKWHDLSLDERRMLDEFDVNSSDSQKVREVDQPGNEHDMQLWTCLLEFAHRRMGRDGITMIWQSVSKRRNLFHVDGPLAARFWGLILDAAISDDNFLQSVVSYAEWLYQTHGVRWPELYATVMTQMLQNIAKSPGPEAFEWRDSIKRWHVVLAPSFSPSEDEFGVLMTTFASSRSRIMFDAVSSLYIHSPFRRMYDILIPHLYNEGCVVLAYQWRSILLSHADIPMSLASRPFLRCYGGYFTTACLTQRELIVAGLFLHQDDLEKPESLPPEAAMTEQNLSYLINRVHGDTFGITEKPYNDSMGARWFASSWVSLDFAINVIYTMGVPAIGPLSLQSIALREEGAPGVRRRMEQLRQLNIGLPSTTYVRAIGHYAEAGDTVALQELLRSDIHPDIFDDKKAQHKLLNDSLRVGDWKTYHLLLKTRLAVLSGSRVIATNSVLETCVHQGNGPMALKIMRDMMSQRLELAPLTSHMLSSFILQNISPHVDKTQSNSEDSLQQLDLHKSLALQLAATRFPPAVEVWQTLLYRIGREKRLEDLERLCLHILRLYTDYAHNSEEPMWMAHMADVPPIQRLELPFPKFQKIPRGLSIRHEKHPLRQIFDIPLQNSIVRWGFLYTPYNLQAQGAAADILSNPAAASCANVVSSSFHMARGLRLIAKLRDGGLWVTPPSVRKEAELRIVDLFRGEGRSDYKWVGGNARKTWLRRQLRFTLAEAKKLCDEAWGKELLPSLVELKQMIVQTEQVDNLNSWKKRADKLKQQKL